MPYASRGQPPAGSGSISKPSWSVSAAPILLQACLPPWPRLLSLYRQLCRHFFTGPVFVPGRNFHTVAMQFTSEQKLYVAFEVLSSLVCMGGGLGARYPRRCCEHAIVTHPRGRDRPEAASNARAVAVCGASSEKRKLRMLVFSTRRCECVRMCA